MARARASPTTSGPSKHRPARSSTPRPTGSGRGTKSRTMIAARCLVPGVKPLRLTIRSVRQVGGKRRLRRRRGGRAAAPATTNAPPGTRRLIADVIGRGHPSGDRDSGNDRGCKPNGIRRAVEPGNPPVHVGPLDRPIARHGAVDPNPRTARAKGPSPGFELPNLGRCRADLLRPRVH